MMRAMITITVLGAALFAGCLDTTSYSTPDRSEKVAKYILKKVPEKIQFPLDASMEDKIKLIGYDLNDESFKPGEVVEVTWYWKCLAPTGPGWRLFTHALDAEGRSRANKDKDGPVRKYFQPEHWLPGMIIKDVQNIAVPRNWKSDFIELRTGIWKGDMRMAGKGKSVDERQRIIGPRIPVYVVKELEAQIPKAKKAPVLDGDIEGDPAWQSASSLPPFVQTLSADPIEKQTDVKLIWDEKFLYVAMRADDQLLKSKFDTNDQEIWKEDAFEIFLDPQGDKKNYYELQVSPRGVVFDSFLPEHRKNQNEWTSDMRVKVSTKGKVNDNSDKDTEWSAELAIPFAALKVDDRATVREGGKWRANFFRINATDKKTEYSAWSPPLRGDFHALDRFGIITFVNEIEKNEGELKEETKQKNKPVESQEVKAEKKDKKEKGDSKAPPPPATPDGDKK